MYAVTSSRMIPLSLWTIEELVDAFDGDLIYWRGEANGCYVTIGFQGVEDLNNFTEAVDRLTTPIVEVQTPYYVSLWRKFIGRVISITNSVRKTT